MKEKVENPALKNNLTIEGISNFFANLLSGNQIANNLEIKKLAHINKLEIPDRLKVEGHTEIHDLEVKENFKSKVFSITNDRITFNPDATIKMSDSRLVFKVKDIFEVITFMKYIVNICGSKLEKCNFGNLLKENKDLHTKVLEIINQSKNITLPELSNSSNISEQINSSNSKISSISTNSEKSGKSLNKNLRNSNKNEEIRINNTEKTLKQITRNNNDNINSNLTLENSTNSINSDINFKFKEKTEKMSDLEKELSSQLEEYKRKQKRISMYSDFENSYDGIDNDNLNSYYYNSFIPNY